MLATQRTVRLTGFSQTASVVSGPLTNRGERQIRTSLLRCIPRATHLNGVKTAKLTDQGLRGKEIGAAETTPSQPLISYVGALSSTALLSITAAAVSADSGFLAGFDWSDPVSMVKALGILTAVVAVHECGHFLAARLQNIHVSKFAIGFGPSVVRYQGRVVEYSLRAIPLGGFVAFPDDDPDSPYPIDDPDLLRNRSVRDRAVVICAGVIANAIFAFAILLFQASVVGIPTEVLEPGIAIPRVIKNSTASKSGFEPGDVIMSVDGIAAAPEPKAILQIVDLIETHPNRPLHFVLDRQGKDVVIDATPSNSSGHGRLGMQLITRRQFYDRIASNPIQTLAFASREFGRLGGEILNGLQQLIFNFSQSAEQVSGPVAMIAMGAEVAKMDNSQLYSFAAVININLAIVNMLPLPALDGGYFALLILEAIRGGKKLPQVVEKGVTASGIVFLLAVGFLLVVRDTVHLASL